MQAPLPACLRHAARHQQRLAGLPPLAQQGVHGALAGALHGAGVDEPQVGRVALLVAHQAAPTAFIEGGGAAHSGTRQVARRAQLSAGILVAVEQGCSEYTVTFLLEAILLQLAHHVLAVTRVVAAEGAGEQALPGLKESWLASGGKTS